ncbi:MAG TPA: response regulator [Tepidisphaeraceae bacterium]|nr:response regulator [Tepidisphaeraceae bacterium]
MKPASILVTDDESNIRLTVRTALETEGYLVREAANGRDALEAIEKQTPDLMVLDLNMPVLDGMQVLEQLKSLAAKNKPRVMVLTAYGSIPTAVKATRLGAVEFLEKPIDPTELRQTVRSILTEPEVDAPSTAIVEIPGGYEQVLTRIRKSLRLADYSSAESLLEKAAARKNQHTAEYFNLLGVLYEAHRKWRLARKCYGKAIAADKHFEPAQANMRRLFELHTYGRSTQAVTLGDESDDIWYARMPDTQLGRMQ